jgi:hypothetical protein
MKFLISVTALAALVCFIPALAINPTAQAAVTTRSGILFAPKPGHSLSVEKERRLEQALRRLTGLNELSFSDDGWLSLGDASSAQSGSSTAREILAQALGSNLVYIIEDHSRSSDVHFGQLDEGLKYSDDRIDEAPITVWRLRLDFEDFRQMQASPEVRASFDEGITLLHELLHGLGLKDTKQPNEVGPCEEAVNRVRSELDLPLRDSYLGDEQRITPFLYTIRLKFKSRVWRQSRPRWKSHYLFFTVERRPR